MTEYRDGEPCTYVPGLDDPRLLAIGWLGPGFHPRGRTSRAVRTSVARLLALAETTVWPHYLFLGPHECEVGLCRPRWAFWRALDTGELFVPGDGVVYVAPRMIRHYLSRHRYRPPDAFCDAVVRHRPRSIDEHVAALRAIVPAIPAL